jgi:hypothetical protein
VGVEFVDWIVACEIACRRAYKLHHDAYGEVSYETDQMLSVSLYKRLPTPSAVL